MLLQQTHETNYSCTFAEDHWNTLTISFYTKYTNNMQRVFSEQFIHHVSKKTQTHVIIQRNLIKSAVVLAY